MQQWEYRVLTLRAGHYTEALNEYGREGWELVSVASDVRGAPALGDSAGTTFMPRAFGRLEDAAAKLNKLGSSDSADVPEPTTATTLLWVLRRPLNED